MMIEKNTIMQQTIGLMGLMSPMGLMKPMRLMGIMLLFSLSLSAQDNTDGDDNDNDDTPTQTETPTTPTFNPPVIKGNVYGGGNQGNVKGNATVTVRGGDIDQVYGGARMADVGGRTLVNLDGKNADSDILIRNVYAGNDIAGTIGESGEATTVPEELEGVLKEGETKETHPKKNAIDNSWKTFLCTSRSVNTTTGKENKAIIVGNVFGGGNGDYYYTTTADNDGNYYVFQKEGDQNHIASGKTPFIKPELDKTYLEIKGGLIAHLYGGGNNATIRENTTIYIDDESTDLGNQVEQYVTDMTAAGYPTTFENVLAYMLRKVSLNTFQNDFTNWNFHFARVFGGNNKAPMAIHPTWNLQRGRIRDLYSGGNQGDMTHPKGILLDINPVPDENGKTDQLFIHNVYGGCRMADVHPLQPDGSEVTEILGIDGYYFPKNLAARVVVQGGDIENVYGGNDIRGKVYFGDAVGISTSIRGNVYGGGNGNYAYTDNLANAENETFSDFFYDPSGTTSTDALNAIRPNAEQVSIMVRGKDAQHPTIIHGAIYCGGNCATLKNDNPSSALLDLKIGSHVIADKVFLGNNGENMVNEDILKLYAGQYEFNGKTLDDYSSLSLKDPSVFASYMEGVSMNIIPTVSVEDRAKGDRNDYEAYSSYIGSMYLGGNVGSMSYQGLNTMDFKYPINVYNKIVGGCNNANITETDLNAAYEGGIIGDEHERGNSSNEFYTDNGAEDGKIKDRLIMNLNGAKIEPKRLAKNPDGTYKTDENDSHYLEWNTVKWGEVDSYTAVKNGTTLTKDKTYYTYTPPTTEGEEGTYTGFTAAGTEEANGSNYFTRDEGFIEIPIDNRTEDNDRRLANGNVYGGCYESGHVNGNVIINIDQTLIKKDEVFAEDQKNEDDSYKIKDGLNPGSPGYNSGVILYNQTFDVLSLAMSTFGAGKGEDTEIWGSTTVNLNKGYTIQAYGGGEEGVVGKKKDDEYVFNPAYSSTVNLNGTVTANDNDSEVTNIAEAEYLYGGGNEGDVCGNTYVNLGNGRIYDAFGGASDANILGHSEVHIGRQPDSSSETGYKRGFPWVRDIVYGGNDFGGTIEGEFEGGYDFTKRVRDWNNDKYLLHGYDPTKDEAPKTLMGAAYVEYTEGLVDSIYGGNYGQYNYALVRYRDDDGEISKVPFVHSSTVNIRPNDNPKNKVDVVLGGSTGYPGYRDSDKMQQHSYVLIDLPDNLTDVDEAGNNTNNFSALEVFGAGSYGGLGMNKTRAETTAEGFELDEVSAVIDLLHGNAGIDNVYGGSFNEGNTRRTVINVPSYTNGAISKSSTIKVGSIFGGAYGTQTLPPCDVYESNVNYASETARLTGAIYGGNNNERRTLYTHVNISSPIWSNKKTGYLGSVYGAGRGENTWSEYTEVNLNDGAYVYQVYGGGQEGHVLNSLTVNKYMTDYWNAQGCSSASDPKWLDAWTFGDYYTPPTNGSFTGYVDNNPYVNLNNPQPGMVRKAEMDDRTGEEKTYKYNTNVIINKGATVERYAYGGGLGVSSKPHSGDVWGTTYIALLGGVVKANLYAAGSSGGVHTNFGMTNFTASANAYIGGGTARNVFGGGWEGHVGIADTPAETHVVVGEIKDGATFFDGVPAVERNAYAGGEGGSVFGTANVTVNNGYIGYRYLGSDSPYYYTYEEGSFDGDDKPESDVLKPANTPLDECFVEKLNDETNIDKNTHVWLGNQSLIDCGCVYGSGYDDISSVDNTNVYLYGGTVRNSVFGGGEISIVGRGTRSSDTAWPVITKAGLASVYMYNGHVKHNVYGGGKGYNTLGYGYGAHNMHTEGMVFGQTRVYIHGGEIGTEEGVLSTDELGDVGNVFGGGDAGVVYSAYELKNGTTYTTYFGKKPDGSIRYDKGDEGYYYKSNGTDFVDDNGAKLAENAEKHLTEDCKVVIEPWLQAKAEIEYGDKTYKAGDYVPIDYLNSLGQKTGNTWPAGWEKVDVGSAEKERGVIIHNAVFAGGNIIRGAGLSANTTTVYGNATASVHDVYNRDFITLGTGNIGGLYGDGNLTLVDGYRELNITNYGTDYYHINPDDIGNKHIDISVYNALPNREKDYYDVRYECKEPCTDNNNKSYSSGSTLSEDELLAQFLIYDETDNKLKSLEANGKTILNYNEDKKIWEPNPACWEQKGTVSLYAGRVLNTIQRADFCGVFGSRMVMKGAYDRVLDKPNGINYTINRVREVSLNKKTKTGSPDHGNYFGIFNNVNYLGALTSDLDFYTDIRHTDNENSMYKETANDIDYGAAGASFANWKSAFPTDNRRNNGLSHNKVALASGVYLELTTEESTGTGLREKVWGPINGVVQLDLINVGTGVGGGYVYAKNIHGERAATGKIQTILTDLNLNAVTMKRWKYIETDNTASPTQQEWQTSGNFVHNTKKIIDDCYNIKRRYKMGEDPMPAHYWYISGDVYIYDQTILAYTGAPNAYSETSDIPLTITANSHGQVKLLDVQPNLYAYYAQYSNETTNTPLTAESKLVVDDVTYSLNDPISYWDWSQLSPSEQALFVDETYVNTVTCKIENVDYPAGTYVMTKAMYDAFNKTVTDAVGGTIYDTNGQPAGKAYIFRSSNNVSHDTGYALTYKMTNPGVWDTWYTPATGAPNGKTQTETNGYLAGPTYRPTTAGLYGQQEYGLSDIIPEAIFRNFEGITVNDEGTTTGNATQGIRNQHSEALVGTQATFGRAYITTQYVETRNKDNHEQHLQAGAKLAQAEYTESQWTALSSKVAAAYVATKTIQLSETELIYAGNLMTAAEKDTYYNRYHKTGATEAEEAIAAQINSLIVPAYYCTGSGAYGGNYYETTGNYPIQETLNSMTTEDLNKAAFTFNYDALDLLIDPNYSVDNNGDIIHLEGKKYQYDGSNYTTEEQVKDASTGNKAGYSIKQSVDYQATYQDNDHPLTYKTDDGGTTTTTDRNVLTRTEYESLINEKRHYTPVTVTEQGTYYIVNTGFYYNDPYAVGQTIPEETYNNLPEDEQFNVTSVELNAGNYYYCRETYTIDATIGHAVKDIVGTEATYTKGQTVPVGTIIGQNDATVGEGESALTYYGYNSLTNQQTNFLIEGITPVETSTLYVTRNSDINDLSKEKIITVVYQYDYEESDSHGNITPISERHVVNIHLQFKSGEPELGEIRAPGIVLPGRSVTPKAPSMLKGAYEIIGGGWELYEDEAHARNHVNGAEYKPSNDLLYWYQDGYYLAYYAKSYFGKTYSNYVPVAVANYHDLKEVMEDLENHLHVDHDKVKRDCKIYINDYSGDTKDGLDRFKDFYDLSLLTSTSTGVTDGVVTTGNLEGHSIMNERVQGGSNLEFFLHTDIDHSTKVVPNPDYDPNAPESPATITIPNEWTPIASGENEPCFSGKFHGDGHTISGLDNSLFGKLCGDVYNLGVTGSFTSAGVADTGDGYAENCWIKTTGTTPLSTKPYPVFGNPTDNKGYQVVNSYFWDGNKNLYNYPEDNTVITYTNNAKGEVIAKPIQSFYNGELAYDLNSFYLNKRYYNTKDLSATGKAYKYLQPAEDGTLPEEMSTGYYPADADRQSYARYSDLGYVEERFADGDYRYVGDNGGIIPTDADIRMRIVTEKDEDNNDISVQYFTPIWPDDYLFFGQKLNYNHIPGLTHDDHPTAIARSESRLASGVQSNRVYRAPAYFRSKEMGAAHFNANAVFAKTKKDEPQAIAYMGMTAIDFSGYNDKYGANGAERTYEQGLNSTKFYAPLLDDDGITGFHNIDLTQNLLAYTAEPGTDAAGISATTVSAALPEPEYAENNKTTTPGNYDYRAVAEQNPSDVNGHWVKKSDTGYEAILDHFLVDKQDFNAPISYAFTGDKRMWYQRIPDNYVNISTGWEGISLPFTAELVTTNDKGEITHFYSGSSNSFNSTGSKIGHEYWLREFTDINTSTGEVAVADFNYPVSTNTDADKSYNNTFLWDYYYQGSHGHKDANNETYQTYYQTGHTYEKYAHLTNGVPYIIGFPSKAYYEFDLSGNFEANTTASTRPVKLPQQTITFASDKNATIGVSDDETTGVTKDGYTFKPSYMNENLETGSGNWALSTVGDSYDKVPATGDDATLVTAFRPYFAAASGGGVRAYRNYARSIVFNRNAAQMNNDEDDDDISDSGELYIYAKGRDIYTVSTLKENISIQIINAAGATLTTYTLEPGKTIITPVTAPGTYIVNKKKLFIK